MNQLFTIIGYLATASLIVFLLRKLLGKKKSKADDFLVDIAHPDDPLPTTPEASEEPKANHNLSPVQEKKLTFLFNLLDFNRNGYIQKDDFVNIAENMSIVKAETLTDHHVDSVRKFMEKSWTHLSHVESDHYKISRSEWLHFAGLEIVNCDEKTYYENIGKLVHAIFLFFDDNKDNYLSLAEYMSLLASFRADFRSARQSFQMLDTNRDGLISEDELSHAVWAFFHSSDPNEEGNWLFGEWEGTS